MEMACVRPPIVSSSGTLTSVSPGYGMLIVVTFLRQVAKSELPGEWVVGE